MSPEPKARKQVKPVKDYRIQMMVWQRHQEDRPRRSDYDGWCEKVAEEIGIEPDEVQEILTRQFTRFSVDLQHEIRTIAQNTAEMMGLDRVEIVKAIKEGLTAMDEVPVKDRQTGTIEMVKKPDNRARLVAAKLGMELHGMMAPEQLEVQHQHNHRVEIMSHEDILKQIAEIDADTQRLISAGTSA